MIKKFYIVLLLAVSSNFAFAQKEEVLKVLKKYKVNTDVLDPNLRDHMERYAYSLERTVTISGKDKVYRANFDPAKDEANRWILVAVNGKSPSKHDVKAFNDEHAIKIHFKVDEGSYKVVKDDGNMIAISYQYDPSSLDSDHQFLKDCLITLFINAKTRLLEKSDELNLKDLKIKILKVTKLSGNLSYVYHEATQGYTLANETVTIVIKMLGNEIPMVTRNKYTIATQPAVIK